MSEFPRGWVFTSQAGAGSTASITVNAINGVAHVLDAVSAAIVSTAIAAAFSTTILADTGSGSKPIVMLALPGGAVGRDSDSADLGLATPTAGPLTVSFAAATPAGYTGLLVIHGHDI